LCLILSLIDEVGAEQLAATKTPPPSTAIVVSTCLCVGRVGTG